MSMEICADCGGFDLEWMKACQKHGCQTCRGCSCPWCDEEALDDYEEDGPMDLEDQLERALDAGSPDPTPWCSGCGAMRKTDCHCGPLADNE